MARIYQNFLGGETDAALTDSGTSLSSPALAAMQAVASPDVMLLVLDPDGIVGEPEIVTVTAHTAAATTATITRGDKGTTARAHASGIEWGHGPLAQDISEAHQLVHVRDEKTAGTSGGTFTSGAWQTRTLNTAVTNEVTGASLASNAVTLPAGTYRVNAHAPGWGVGRHKLRLYNVTGAATLIVGSSEYSAPANAGTSRSMLNGKFTLSTASDVRLEHRCETTVATQGFGVEDNFSVVEVYAEMLLWKVA